MSEPDPLAVTISTREIYDQIVGLRGDVRSLTESGETVRQIQADHEQRLRGIERWKYSLPATVAAAVATGLVVLARASGTA